MSKSNTPNYWRKTTTDAEIAFGEVFLNGIKCAAVLRNVDPTLSKSQYLAFLNSGKLKGGTVNRCPGVYQIRGIRDVIVVKVIDNEQLNSASNDLYNYSLLEMKYISEGNAVETAKNIKSEALKIPGLVKFEVRTRTILKIRNY